jgi:hypothetical protein
MIVAVEKNTVVWIDLNSLPLVQSHTYFSPRWSVGHPPDTAGGFPDRSAATARNPFSGFLPVSHAPPNQPTLSVVLATDQAPPRRSRANAPASLLVYRSPSHRSLTQIGTAEILEGKVLFTFQHATPATGALCKT